MPFLEDNYWKLSYLTYLGLITIAVVSTNAISIDASGSLHNPQVNITFWDQIINESKSRGCLFPPTAASEPENVCQMPLSSLRAKNRQLLSFIYSLQLCWALRGLTLHVCNVPSKTLPDYKPNPLDNNEDKGCSELYDDLKETSSYGTNVSLPLWSFVNNTGHCQYYCFESSENNTNLCNLLHYGLKLVVATEKDRRSGSPIPSPLSNKSNEGGTSNTSNPSLHAASNSRAEDDLRSQNNPQTKASSGIAATAPAVNEPTTDKVPKMVQSSSTTVASRSTKIKDGDGSSGSSSSVMQQTNDKTATNQKKSISQVSTTSETSKPNSSPPTSTWQARPGGNVNAANDSKAKAVAVDVIPATLKPNHQRLPASGTVPEKTLPVQKTTIGEAEPQTMASQISEPNTNGQKTSFQTVTSDAATKDAPISKTAAPKLKVSVPPQEPDDFKDIGDVNEGKTADTESENIAFMGEETPSLSENDSQTNDASDLDFASDNTNVKQIDSSGGEMPAPQFPEYTDSHFFTYFLTVVVLCIIVYLVFHNKQKIIALIIEGRHERRRRPSTANYKKLDSNLEEVMQGGTKGVTSAHIIY